MTPCERLNEILARSEKATEGPWKKDYGGTRYHIKSTGDHPYGMTPTVARYDTAVLTIELEEQDRNGEFIAAARTDLPALAKCLLAAIGPLERCRDKLIELRDSERMLGASAYERALIQYRIDEANEALDIINRELGE